MFREEEDELSFTISNKVDVRNSDIHGLGVFTTKPIKKYEIIEVAPVVLIAQDTLSTLRSFYEQRHVLHDYVFLWSEGRVAFPLGYAGLYNHAWDPNAFWRCNEEGPGRLIIRAKRDIDVNEEITIRYNSDPDKLPFIDEDANAGRTGHYDLYKHRRGESPTEAFGRAVHQVGNHFKEKIKKDKID
jgi:hypothetical protein